MSRPAIDRLLDPGSVAIVGTSPSGGRGARAHQNLLRSAFQGQLWAVNPRYDSVFDTPCLPSLAAIPEPVDCAIVALPADAALGVLEEARGSGLGGVVLFASGFGEAGPEGVERQRRLRQIAAEANLAVCGPNCLGLVNVQRGLMATSAPLPKPPVAGSVALVSQSGALMTEVAGPLVERSIGVSWLISAGNEAVTTTEDYLAYLIEQPQVRVVGAVVEAFRQPDRLSAVAARAAEKGVPLVILKIGRSEAGQRAAASHTGALAGDARVLAAAFDHWGITAVASTEELIETLILFSQDRWPLSDRVALVSSSGGRCGILGDLAADLGLELAAFSDDTQRKLQAVLPPFSTIHNPLDPTGVVFDRAGVYAPVLSAVAADPNVGLVGVYQMARNTATDTSGERAERLAGIASEVAEAAASTDKPFVVFTTAAGGSLDERVTAAVREAELPFLQGTDRALAAIRNAVRYAAFQRSGAPAPKRPSPAPEVSAFLPRLAEQQALSEHDSKSLLAAYGVAVPARELVSSESQALEAAARLGYPVALKACSPQIAHKSEQGLVALPIGNHAALAQAFADIWNKAKQIEGLEGILVEALAPAGVEVMVGLRWTDFGPVLVFGAGGLLAELVDDSSVHLAPLSLADATAAISQRRVARLLAGFRGQPPVNIPALADALVCLSWLAYDLGEAIQTVDVNPLIVSSEGVVAVDAKVLGR